MRKRPIRLFLQFLSLSITCTPMPLFSQVDSEGAFSNGFCILSPNSDQLSYINNPAERSMDSGATLPQSYTSQTEGKLRAPDDLSSPPPSLAPPLLNPSSTLPALTSSALPIPTAPLTPGAGPLNAGSPYRNFEAAQDETFIINFNNVSIIEYIRFISKISNTNFVFQESDLHFNVTIVSEEPTSIDNIMAALIQILRIHGLSLFEQGNNLIIYHSADIAKIATVVTEEGQQLTAPLITRVIKLNYINPERARAIIQPLLSNQASIEVSVETRHLIITDMVTNIEKTLQLIHSLDIPNTAIEVGSYTTEYSIPTNLIIIAEKILAPIAVAEGVPITLVPQSSTNTIFVVSTTDLIQKTLTILQSLDKPTNPDLASAQNTRVSAIEIVTYLAQNLPPAALIPPAEKILLPIARQENVSFSLVPHPTANSIYIISTPELIQRALATLRSLDQAPLNGPQEIVVPPSDIQGTIFFLYKLQYHKGNQIQEAMEEVGSSLSRAGLANSDLISTIASMRWIQPNNSLLFTGTPASIQKVKELMHTLDKPLKQVFIEVLVIETSLENSLTFGVQWGVRARHDGSLFLSGGSFSPTPNFSPNFATPPSVPTIPLAGGFDLGVIGNLISHNGNVFASIGALVQALQTERQTKILLNPKILAEDNNTAQVFVGQNSPYTTTNVEIQAANSSTGFTVDYRDIGVLLEVTPYLGNSDLVTIELHQEISEIKEIDPTTPNNVSGFPIPTTNKIVTTTRVHVPDDFFLVISGMIRDQKRFVQTGIPCLGCLPIIGSAFRQDFASSSKHNIIIFIHPKIIKRCIDYTELTDKEGCKFAEKSIPDEGCRAQCVPVDVWSNE